MRQNLQELPMAEFSITTRQRSDDAVLRLVDVLSQGMIVDNI